MPVLDCLFGHLGDNGLGFYTHSAYLAQQLNYMLLVVGKAVGVEFFPNSGVFRGFLFVLVEDPLEGASVAEFVLHGPNKGHYQNKVLFTEIIPLHMTALRRISKPLFNIAAHFTAVDAQTSELVFRMIFETMEECEKLRPYVTDKNEENFDKLEVELQNVVL
jgi:hypothetical protein